MPPKIKITKEQIVYTAFELVKKYGDGALNARTLAKELNCSTQPIFSNYTSMNDLRSDVIAAAKELYQSYQTKEFADGIYPMYKASGMAYIKFAKEEKQLFKLLFMRDRSYENIPDEISEIDNIIEIIEKNMGLSRDTAIAFHIQMWVWVHGIATMIATGYLEWDLDTVSTMMTNAYQGLKKQYETQ